MNKRDGNKAFLVDTYEYGIMIDFIPLYTF